MTRHKIIDNELEALEEHLAKAKEEHTKVLAEDSRRIADRQARLNTEAVASARRRREEVRR